MNPFALPFALMLVFILADVWAMSIFRGRRVPWRDVIFNLNSGHLVLWLFRGIEVAVFAWLSNHLSLHWVGHWNVIGIWVFAFFAWDFCFYWLHRLHHRIPLMWAVHVVHHEGEHFNLSLGVRNSWYSSLTSIPFFAGLAILGVPVEVFIAVSGFHYSVQFYNHCGTIHKSGMLDRFLVTPANHRIHHGLNPEYIDRNFGGTLLIWDKLFGTLQRELPGTQIRYGVRGSTPTCNPFRASNLPVLRYLGFRHRVDLVRSLGRGSTLPDRWIAVGGIVLFGVVIYYVHRQGTWSTGQQPVLCALIVAMTIALGTISDGRRWGRTVWIALAIALPTLFIGVFGLRDLLGCVVFGLLALHGLVSLCVPAAPRHVAGVQ